MDASEFATNYKKYVTEIESLAGAHVSPVVERFKRKDPLTLIKPRTSFQSESEASGLDPY